MRIHHVVQAVKGWPHITDTDRQEGEYKACGLSVSTVHRIWRAFSLQPHRSETFKLSTDPLFVEKVRDQAWWKTADTRDSWRAWKMLPVPTHQEDFPARAAHPSAVVTLGMHTAHRVAVVPESGFR
jgi:hypothetical protein